MRAKLILPALTEAKSPFWRPIKYSLFPPLGLATLAAYFDPDDTVTLTDEHVENVDLNDNPELVAIEVYVSSASRSYELADIYRRRGAHVALGGLHVTAVPKEAARHADTLFLGPGDDTWPQFLADFRAGKTKSVYASTRRDLTGNPPPRRDLIKRRLYLAPNSIVVSRGCPHQCEFCYTTDFLKGGKPFYTSPIDAALAEIDSLPGRHLFFLDDNLFAAPRFADALFDGLQGMGRVWQAAATVGVAQRPALLEKAVRCGLRSLFIGFETLDNANLRRQGKHHNLLTDYSEATARLHSMGVMINASFILGLDSDTPDVFQRTVDWALAHGLETATFHILTPYPGTPLHARLQAQGRIRSQDWDLYDTRHCVFRPAQMSPSELEQGYWRAYTEFYRWSSVLRSAGTKATVAGRLRHLAYTCGWKKLERLWSLLIRARLLPLAVPALEAVLAGIDSRSRARSSPPCNAMPPLPPPRNLTRP